MRHTVCIAGNIPEAGLRLLRDAGLELKVHADRRDLSRVGLLEFVAGAHALITLVSDRVDGELLDAAGKQLRVVANFAVGTNNIDLAACNARGVAVTNTPDVLTEATADLTLALILAVARRLLEGDRLVRSGRWQGWEPRQLLGMGLGGKRLGIVGMGRIGTAVARRALSFGMRVAYHNRRPNEAAEAALDLDYLPDLGALLETSDVVTLHVPLTGETGHLIGARELARMKPGALLVNTSRGPIVDESALVRALREGGIAGAGLDVFEREPELSPGLAELTNVVLAPHLGSATHEARDGMARLCAESVLTVLEGRRPRHLLNPEGMRDAGRGQR